MTQTFDDDIYLTNKTAQVNENGSRGRTDWTEDEVFEAISDAGLSLEQHYEQYGESEGVSPWAEDTTTEDVVDTTTVDTTTEDETNASDAYQDITLDFNIDLDDLEIASVADEMSGLLSEGSPYLDIAQADAMQAANSRGLLNSSLAAGAGTAAAIEGALDIASQDAAAKNELASAAYQQGYDLETLATEQDYTLEQMASENEYTLDQLDTEQDYILEQMASENEYTMAQIDQQYDWESMLTAMGLDADIAEATANNVTDMNQQYMVEWSNIVTNEDLDADTKEEWIADLTEGFVADLSLVFDTSGIDFEVLEDGEFSIGDSDQYTQMVSQDVFDDDIYLSNKTDQANAVAAQGRADWTEDEVADAIEATGLTLEQHYEQYGKSEGVSPYELGYEG